MLGRIVAVVKPGERPFWQAARPRPRATWDADAAGAEAMTFSRRAIHSQRASSSTCILFRLGIALNSKLSRHLTVGKGAAYPALEAAIASIRRSPAQPLTTAIPLSRHLPNAESYQAIADVSGEFPFALSGGALIGSDGLLHRNEPDPWSALRGTADRSDD
jgi:hypothetical protein